MEYIMKAVDWISSNMVVVLSFIGFCAALATVTPNKVDDKFVQFLVDAVNFLGGNFGKAKNKE